MNTIIYQGTRDIINRAYKTPYLKKKKKSSKMNYNSIHDTLIVQSAKQALKIGEVNPILKWVHEKDRNEIINIFNNAIELRNTSPLMKKYIDVYFYEKLINIHINGINNHIKDFIKLKKNI